MMHFNREEITMEIDEQILRGLARDALRTALEEVSAKLLSLSKDPHLASLSGQEALVCASKAILSNNDLTWGKKQKEH